LPDDASNRSASAEEKMLATLAARLRCTQIAISQDVCREVRQVCRLWVPVRRFYMNFVMVVIAVLLLVAILREFKHK
jgi:hypothetical protein